VPEETGWSAPQEFDDYQLVQPLGHGSRGQVYLAYDTVLARHVAVKFIANLEPSAHERQRFLIEARAAARLQHPNVVSIFRVGELGERPFIISELVRGESLEKMAKPVPWTRALQIGIDLARGLAAAHRKGVLHCDLKPANAVLTEEGVAKLLDFGLATLLETRGEEVGATARPPDAQSPRAPPAGAGPVVGTPDYLAPEVWRGEGASRRSDVYSLGSLLYELCAGRPPFADVPDNALPRAVQEREAPPLSQAALGVDWRFAAIIERCLRRDPAARYASGDELREALEQLSRVATGAAIPIGNPYRGLRPYEAEHRALFFGRSAEIGTLLDRMRAEPFVVVTGDSGVGKSSICRAGVLPLVAEGALGMGRSWSVLTVVPGRSPIGALAAALAEPLCTSEEELLRLLRDDPEGAGRTLRRRLGSTQGLVLFVDQLEELVTLGPPEEAPLVEEAVAGLVSGMGGVRFLGTLRADFLTRLASLPFLGEEVSQGLYILRSLSPEKIREAIVGPAEAAGIRFESAELVETLVETTARAQGGLPLLQFALAELWEARDPEAGVIPMAALQAMGGVAGALARHADSALAALPPRQRALVRRLLTRLVTAEGTRARRTEAELCGGDPLARAALDGLVRGRLVVAHDAEEGSAYELTHDVLIQGWGTLRRWLLEDAEHRLVRERLAQAVGEWERLGCSPEGLWSMRQLAETEGLGPGDLSPREATFLERSRRAVRRARRLRQGLIVGIPLLVAAVYAGVELKGRYDLGRRVDHRMGEAQQALEVARQRSAESEELHQGAFARFDARDLVRGEEMWAQAHRMEAAAERSWLLASQALEAAAVLDQSRTDVRALFADVLYERALLAERNHQSQLRDELVQRLALYDDGGERQRRWSAPALLTVASNPPGASVVLHRFTEDSEKKLRLHRLRDLGQTPIAAVETARGSYLLTFELAGRFPVRYPVLLGRGERFRVEVDLPPAPAVPSGFVYIPPGRFLFGSAADEEVRRGFFDTVPLHEVRTGAFLIGRTEVTFAEWLELLRSLPRDERARRQPRVASKVGGATGSIKLTEGAGGWRLTIMPAQRVYTAAAGEKLYYGRRRAREVQDWLRFPVTGISAHDAEAYVAWLDRTGRVPGARLCPTATAWTRRTPTTMRPTARTRWGWAPTRSARTPRRGAPSGSRTCRATPGSGRRPRSPRASMWGAAGATSTTRRRTRS
jgi:formylglycine-generating enzyme required for sulfatase activity